jgi:hypothetical protein
MVCNIIEEDDKNFLEHFSGLKSEPRQGKQDPALGSKMCVSNPVSHEYIMCSMLITPVAV